MESHFLYDRTYYPTKSTASNSLSPEASSKQPSDPPQYLSRSDEKETRINTVPRAYSTRRPRLCALKAFRHSSCTSSRIFADCRKTSSSHEQQPRAGFSFTQMARKATKTASSAEISEAERTDPNAAWEATVTQGMKETESQMVLQWVSVLMVGVAVYGYLYT